MGDTNTHFTFSFFDAAHTDGYVAPVPGAKKQLIQKDNQQQGGGLFFSDEEEDEDIVEKIHHWKKTSSTKTSETKRPQKRREVHDLFSEPVKKEGAEPELNDAIPTASDDIQLNRLLDDYMLGEKGDLIMRQMEDLTTDDPHSPAPVTNSRPSQGDPFNDDQKPNLGNQELSILDNMLSMEDFEKYIAQN